jgi:uncharacterized membrane protein
MMKNINKSKLKNLIVSSKFTIFVVGSLLISLYFAATSMLQPANQNLTTVENTLQQKTEFSYMANVQPSKLYPEGGLVEPDSIIFEKVTKDIPTTIHTSITSVKNIEVEGTFQPTLTIEAGEFWKKELPLGEKQSFQYKGNEQNIVDGTYSINLNEIKDLIETVEEEINVSPDNYLLKVNPNISGNIRYDGNEISVNEGGELIFEYGYNKITLVSEQEFITEIPFENQKAIENTYTILGLTGSLLTVRVLSIISSIILILLLIYRFVMVKENKKARTSEAEKLDQKYASRLVTVTKKIEIVNKSFLILESFDALLQVSDEKELPIFRYEDSNKEEVVYFIIDVDYIFSFEANNKVDTENNIVGSDVSYG